MRELSTISVSYTHSRLRRRSPSGVRSEGLASAHRARPPPTTSASASPAWSQALPACKRWQVQLEAGATYKLVLGAVATLTSRFEVARTHLAEAIQYRRVLAAR